MLPATDDWMDFCASSSSFLACFWASDFSWYLDTSLLIAVLTPVTIRDAPSVIDASSAFEAVAERRKATVRRFCAAVHNSVTFLQVTILNELVACRVLDICCTPIITAITDCIFVCTAISLSLSLTNIDTMPEPAEYAPINPCTPLMTPPICVAPVERAVCSVRSSLYAVPRRSIS